MTKSILLCDDELHILRAAEFKFRRAGYEVRCASDGEEAWSLILEQMPDILITDYQMPRLDGVELAQRIRSHENTADLEIILLSAKSFILADREIARQWGIKAVLSKPFSPRQLLKCVEESFAAREQGAAPAGA